MPGVKDALQLWRGRSLEQSSAYVMQFSRRSCSKVLAYLVFKKKTRMWDIPVPRREKRLVLGSFSGDVVAVFGSFSGHFYSKDRLAHYMERQDET